MRGGDDVKRLVEIVDRALQESFGIDPTSDHVCALSTTGLVVSCWRNTVLESIHAGGFVPNARRGSYARDGIPDRDMARLNVATWRQVRPHVQPAGIDVLALRALLRDKSRLVQVGASTYRCGDLFAGAWTKLAWHLNEGAWLPAQLADRLGGDESATVRFYAVCGGSYAPDWFGNPWWEDAVKGWSNQEPPDDDGDLELALHAPNELGDEAIDWLMRAKYDSSFTDAIAAWQRQRGGLQADSLGGPWFPPGVPDLPPHLR